jgi:N-acylglucosamine 2-epimerase
MDKARIESLKKFYSHYLLEVCLPFWAENGLDKEYGGIITCLDRKGHIYNTDKSVWFQGRATWTFSKIYNVIDKNSKWLDAAKTVYKFLTEHCFDKDSRMFFTVSRDGRPLQKRRYMFSETFAIIACAEYYKATGDVDALDKAEKIFEMVLDLYRHPEKNIPKFNPETRSTKSHSLPMILLSVTQVLREVTKNPYYDSLAAEFSEFVIKNFFKPEEKALFETVGINGERLDSPQGRCINPGHSIETSWFLMHEGMYRNDKALINTAIQILDYSFELGWDKEYGGLFSFIDIEGKPPEQLEWDMKLWWPHTEAMYAMLLAYHLTGDKKYSDKFEMVHEWSFSHFADQEYGEWYGYLHKDGSVSNSLKGNMWKGPFHLPRALLLCIDLLEKMSV